MNTTRSAHYLKLSGDVKLRYESKIEKCSGIDPYSIKNDELSLNRKDFPEITLLDIGNHLVYSASPFTKKAFKAYKSMEAYNFLQSGFVLTVGSKTINNSEDAILIGKVKHSQSMNKSPLKVWILAKMNGEIICAHCTCIAGLSETCSHIGAICFAVADVHKSNESKSVTDVLCKWNVPNFKEASMSKITDVSWRVPNFEEQGSSSQTATSSFVSACESIKRINDEIIFDFLNGIHSDGDEPAGRTVLYPKEKRRLSTLKDEIFLADLYNENYKSETRDELIKIGNSKPLKISKEDKEEISRLTVRHSKSKFWIGLRRGRITGSNLKDCCVTNIDNPSITIINRIINPMKNVDHIPSIKFQIRNKGRAIKDYVKKASVEHTNFRYRERGLVINKETPYFAASSDGMVSCDCHGIGCVEIKCLKLSDSGECFDGLAKQPNNILNKLGDEYFLERTHELYYKVQMQIHLTESNFCDFFIWSPVNVLMLRIFSDFEFWIMAKQKALTFHEQIIMPELLGKFYTRETDLPGSMEEENDYLERTDLNLSMEEDDQDYLELIGLEIEPLNSIKNKD